MRRWLNNARYKLVHWLLVNTHVGRAILFNEWARGFETGKKAR